MGLILQAYNSFRIVYICFFLIGERNRVLDSEAQVRCITIDWISQERDLEVETMSRCLSGSVPGLNTHEREKKEAELGKRRSRAAMHS